MKRRKKNLRKRARSNVCPFCKTKVTTIKWEDYESLKEYLSPRGRILPRSITGVCAKHQKLLTEAIKRARHLALLPFVVKLD
ncbi:30S ribosomal protein S18 [Candidatus Shapirobacteria bacterium]|nr:MAG: 30S ribosomal protein S18 [Candidatus Shapirobacteria bacterium]